MNLSLCNVPRESLWFIVIWFVLLTFSDPTVHSFINFCILNTPILLADVVSIPKTNENFRLLYDTKGRFRLHSIRDEEAKVILTLPFHVGNLILLSLIFSKSSNIVCDLTYNC